MMKPTNPNYEQFGVRLVPFFGDYLTLAAQGATVGVTWTDQRNTVGAPDPSGDNDGADVAGDPETGGTRTSSFMTCFAGTRGAGPSSYRAPDTAPAGADPGGVRAPWPPRRAACNAARAALS